MPCHLALLTVALLAAPLPALAQAWPGGAVVSKARVQASAPYSRTFAVIEPVPRAAPPANRLRTLNPKARTPLDADTPPVDICAKAGWSDDQGFRASPIRVSYKLRF